MPSSRTDLIRRMGQITPQGSPAYDALVDVAQGATSAIMPAQLILACRSMYAWRRDVLGHDDGYLAEYRRALAVVCAAECVEVTR